MYVCSGKKGKKKRKKEYLDILSVDVEMIGDEETKPGRVQVGTGSNDAIGGEAGEFPGHISQHVYWIRHYKQNRVRGVMNQRRNDALKQTHIPLQQIQPRLAGDLTGPGGDDAQIRSDGDGVIGGGMNLRAREEGGGVLEIEHLAAELIGLGVDEDELVGEVLSEDGLGDGHAYIAGADHRDLRMPLRRRRRGSVLNGLEEGLG